MNPFLSIEKSKKWGYHPKILNTWKETIHSYHMSSSSFLQWKPVLVIAGYLTTAGKLHPEQANLLFLGAFSSQGQRNEDVTGLIFGYEDLISVLEERSSKTPVGINTFSFSFFFFFLKSKGNLFRKKFAGKNSLEKTPTSAKTAHYE